jgi:hypothetical protein
MNNWNNWLNKQKPQERKQNALKMWLNKNQFLEDQTLTYFYNMIEELNVFMKNNYNVNLEYLFIRELSISYPNIMTSTISSLLMRDCIDIKASKNPFSFFEFMDDNIKEERDFKDRCLNHSISDIMNAWIVVMSRLSIKMLIEIFGKYDNKFEKCFYDVGLSVIKYN